MDLQKEDYQKKNFSLSNQVLLDYLIKYFIASKKDFLVIITPFILIVF